MVVRPSSSSWSLCPETIMSHHYRLTRGVRSAVDTSPPYSMYNSPISIHYIPKRASSADAARRNTLSRPHRELSAFINSNTPNLRLPLPLRSSRNELVKPKLLGNRNYNPPVRRQTKPPPLPQPPAPIGRQPSRENQGHKKKDRSRHSQTLLEFKDCVYSYVIQRGVFTDGIIIDTVESEMEKWEDQLPWNQLEMLRDEIYEELGVRKEEIVRMAKKRTKPKRSSSVGSSIASFSSSSSSSNSSKKPSSTASSSASTASSRSETSKSQSSKSSDSESEEASSVSSSARSSSSRTSSEGSESN